MSTTYQPGQRDSRPWGTWEILALGPDYAVKRVVVKPGARLSLQRHRHRAEHWIVVGGTASVTRGRDTFPVSAGENTVIGLGDVHRIANLGTADLVFIEVQHGVHLDEADIERLEDDYGRE